MKFISGFWNYNGKRFSTLHDALVFAWDRRCF